MTPTIEQLQQRAALLGQSPNLTNERVDAINDIAWQMLHRYANDSPAAQLNAEALQLANQNGYERGRAYALHNYGWYYLYTDQCQKAEQSLLESQRILLNLKDEAALSSVLNGLAVAKKKTGDYQAALENYWAALKLHQKSGNQAGVAKILINLGGVYSRSSDYSVALEYYYRALQIMESSSASTANQTLILSHSHSNLGDVLWRVGEATQSIEHSQQALGIYRAHSNRFFECMSLVNLGAAYHTQRQYQEALDFYGRGLEMAERAQNFEAQAEVQIYLGKVYYETGDWPTALIHLSQALQQSQKIINRFYEGETLLWLGLLYKELNNRTKSLEALEQALIISEELDAKEICCKTHLALSELYQEANKSSKALSHHQDFYRIWQEIFGSTTWQRIGQLLMQREMMQLGRSKKLQLSPEDESISDIKLLDATRGALSPRKLQDVLNYITQHIEQNLTLTELSDMAGLSQNYFLRSFKQATGKTPHQFIIEQRVAQTKALLQTTELPLAEVALRCGFSSQSHLTTHFRMQTGTTPREYRQSLRRVVPPKKY